MLAAAAPHMHWAMIQVLRQSTGSAGYALYQLAQVTLARPEFPIYIWVSSRVFYDRYGELFRTYGYPVSYPDDTRDTRWVKRSFRVLTGVMTLVQKRAGNQEYCGGTRARANMLRAASACRWH